MNGDVTVREVMDREFVGASESDGLAETVELMLEEGSDSVVVLRGSEPVGVLTERDALAAFVDGDAGDRSVGEAMTESVPTVSPAVTISEAADEMSANTTKRLLVSDGTEPLGVLTEHDLITTSPFAPTADATAAAAEDRPVAGVTAGRGEAAADADPRTGFDDQSVCEACGSLARDLSPFNGQLLCGDCRDI